jgi:MOSC domain-containing protein YiiM
MMKNLVYEVQSLAVGKPQNALFGKKKVATAIHKYPVNGSVYLAKTNFEGDEQADKKNHGGPDKAVCAYSYDRYTFWEDIYGHELENNQFGENLSIKALTEENINVGDIFSFGEAVLQVSQPRIPCFKLGIRTGKPDLVQRFQETGYTGFYFRVLQPGFVSHRDALVFKDREKDSKSIMELNKLFFSKLETTDKLEELLDLPSLSEGYKKSVVSKISRIQI